MADMEERVFSVFVFLIALGFVGLGGLGLFFIYGFIWRRF